VVSNSTEIGRKRDGLLSIISLSNRKGRLINFGTLVVFMVRVYNERVLRERGEGGGHKGEEWVVGWRASEHQRKKEKVPNAGLL